jgi:phosphoribosyl-dephospho-CoA transferase
VYISLRQVRIPPSNHEVLSVTYVARGPVNASQTWEKGFDIGHEAITATFLSMTSAQAQEHWRRRS